jgi:hypothetical protein
MSNYTNFRDFKTFLVIYLQTLPLTLFLLNGCVLEKSVSEYVNVTPLAFGVLFTIASLTIFVDGYVERKRWYNMVTGGALFMVTVLMNSKFPITHYSFAGVFFVTPVVVMVYDIIKSSDIKERMLLTGMLVLITFGMLGHFIGHWYSLFFAECIGMIPVSVVIYRGIRLNKTLLSK